MMEQLNWIKLSDSLPEIDTTILHFDSLRNDFALVYFNKESKMCAVQYGCNKDDCTYISDTCSCPFEIYADENGYWMPLPKEPNERRNDKVE